MGKMNSILLPKPYFCALFRHPLLSPHRRSAVCGGPGHQARTALSDSMDRRSGEERPEPDWTSCSISITVQPCECFYRRLHAPDESRGPSECENTLGRPVHTPLQPLVPRWASTVEVCFQSAVEATPMPSTTPPLSNTSPYQGNPEVCRSNLGNFGVLSRRDTGS